MVLGCPFSSSLDLMKTVGAFCFGEEPSGSPSGDPEEILSSEGSEDAETSPPCGASLWLGVTEIHPSRRGECFKAPC